MYAFFSNILSDAFFPSLAIRDQIKPMAQSESHKRPSGANEAIHPSQMEGGYWQQPENRLLTPLSRFPFWVIHSRQTQQANNGLPSRESLCQDITVRWMVVIGLFSNSKLHFWVTVGEKEALQKPKQRCLARVIRTGELVLLTTWKMPNVSGRQANKS